MGTEAELVILCGCAWGTELVFMWNIWLGVLMIMLVSIRDCQYVYKLPFQLSSSNFLDITNLLTVECTSTSSDANQREAYRAKVGH